MRQFNIHEINAVLHSSFIKIFRWKIIFLLLILLFQSQLTPVSADTAASSIYYVSVTGNNSNPGTQSQPWRTLGKAASVIKPGDTVYVRGGTYNEAVTLSISGTAASPISFLAYADETPIIDGGNTIPGTGSFLLNISGDYINASGFEVRNSAYGGILVFGSYDTVSKMFSHHNREMGIFVGKGQHSTVEDSRIWRNSLSNENGKAGMWSSGLSAGRFGVGYATLRHNIVWGNWGEGISTGESDHTIIEDNIVYDNYTANIYILDATNVVCQRNLVYASGALSGGDQVGIMMGDEKYTPASANIKILNNMVYGTNRNFFWWQGLQGGGMKNVTIAFNTFANSSANAGVIIGSGTHQAVYFENNLTLQEGSLPVILLVQNPELHFSNNLWSKTPLSAASSSTDVIADPKLKKNSSVGPGQLTAEYFKIQADSLAIQRAKAISSIPTDYFLTLRDLSTPDIGAYEFVSSDPEPAPNPAPPAQFSLYLPFYKTKR